MHVSRCRERSAGTPQALHPFFLPPLPRKSPRGAGKGGGDPCYSTLTHLCPGSAHPSWMMKGTEAHLTFPRNSVLEWKGSGLLRMPCDSPTLTGWSTTWRQRQSHCTLGSGPGSSQSTSNGHQPNRLSSHPKPSQTRHVSRNSASTFSPCPLHHHCLQPGCWRDGEEGCTRGPSTLQHSAVGFPAEKLLKKLEKAISLLRKKKSLTVEAQEQIPELYFLRSFAGYAHRSRSSRHPHASLI